MSCRKVVPVVAALAVAALLAAGCSSGTKPAATSAKSSSTTRRATTTTGATGGAGAASNATTTTAGSAAAPPTTTAPGGGSASKATFLTEANSICKQTNAQTKAVGDRLPSNPTPAEQASALDESSNIIQAAIARMQGLNQPAGDRTNLVLFYQRSQQLVALTHLLADAFRAQDQAKVTSVETEANDLDDQLTHAADAYGLTACGSGSGQ